MLAMNPEFSDKFTTYRAFSIGLHMAHHNTVFRFGHWAFGQQAEENWAVEVSTKLYLLIMIIRIMTHLFYVAFSSVVLEKNWSYTFKAVLKRWVLVSVLKVVRSVQSQVQCLVPCGKMRASACKLRASLHITEPSLCCQNIGSLVLILLNLNLLLSCLRWGLNQSSFWILTCLGTTMAHKCFRGSVSAFLLQTVKQQITLPSVWISCWQAVKLCYSILTVLVFSYYNNLLSVRTAKMSMLSIFCIYFECNHIFYV